MANPSPVRVKAVLDAQFKRSDDDGAQLAASPVSIKFTTEQKAFLDQHPDRSALLRSLVQKHMELAEKSSSISRGRESQALQPDRQPG